MKRHALVDVDRCVACGACMNVCRLQAISVYRGSYAVVDVKKCVGCGLCAKNCPAGSIVVVRNE